jgi:Flp pilus assembly protein TadD
MANNQENPEAIALKDEGNKLFADGKLDEAEAVYTKAIALDDNMEALFSNR